MSEVKKLEQSEIESITKIRRNYFNIQNIIGQIRLSKVNLENQLDSLHKQEEQIMEEYKHTQNSEKEFIENLQKKYGIGTLDIEKGEFVPTPNQPIEQTEKNS